MSSSTVWRPDCQLRPSRLERRQRLLVLALVLLSLCAGHPPPLWRAGLLLTLLPAAWWYLRRPSDAYPVIALRQIASGWRLRLADGEEVLADLHGPVRDWGCLLCLGWREQPGVAAGRPRQWRAVLWSDQLAPDDWRRLRVSLVWRRLALPAALAAQRGRSSEP